MKHRHIPRKSKVPKSGRQVIEPGQFINSKPRTADHPWRERLRKAKEGRV